MGKSTRRILIVIAAIMLFGSVLMGCNSWGQAADNKTPDNLNLPEMPEEPGRVWLETDPIQAWHNPWREWLWEEWIGRNYNEWTQTYQDYWIEEQDFPDCSSHCEQIVGQLPERACMIACLVKHYYLMQEITVYNVEVSTYQEKFGHEIAICEAEDCAAGYTLYVQVAETDVNRMFELGYRNIVTSCASIPADIYVYGCSQ